MPFKNPTEAAAYQKKWRADHPEHLDRRKLYRLRNPERVKESKRRCRYKGLMITRPKPAQCEVCGRKARLHLDHDHALGIFRGWLCPRCNHALGHARDNPLILRALADYLERAWGIKSGRPPDLRQSSGV